MRLKQKLIGFAVRLSHTLGSLRKTTIFLVGLLMVSFGGFYLYQNTHAVSALQTAKSFDNKGQYGRAKQTLQSIHKTLVRASTKAQIQAELQRNQQLAETQQKIQEVQKLLGEHNAKAAQALLGQLKSTGVDNNNQLNDLQKAVAQQLSTPKPGPTKTGNGTTSSGGSSGSTGGTGSGGGSGGGASSGSGGGPNTGPLSSLNIVSFTASASAATAASCNITGSVTFGADGSGNVTVTWSQYSSKTVSQTQNPVNFSFPAAGTKADGVNFGGSQGLEPGDSYRISATITSASNPAISVTTSPVTISSCAAPPALASEQGSAFMTTITPGTPTIYQAHDGIFSNECSVQVSTPYSVNGSGTVEAIVLVTSGSSIGYTYYDNSVTGFTSAGSATDTSYFRLPHLPGSGHYNIQVKLVEVSTSNTVYAYTSSLSSSCD